MKRIILVLLFALGSTHVLACGHLLQFFTKFRRAHFWQHRELVRQFGLDRDYIEKRLREFRRHPEWQQLMNGYSAERISVRAGWGQDFLFIPSFALWRQVNDSFLPLAERMEAKLGLHPLLTAQLFRGDHISIADSGWVIVGDSETSSSASVKVTHYDPDMTPDGPWPRYSVESIVSPFSFLLYTTTGRIEGPLADDILGGYYSIRSSMEHWGLLPLEVHTGEHIAEHTVGRYPTHPGLFTEPFFLKHQVLMSNVIGNHGTPTVTSLLNGLREFRKREIPPEALEVAELGRFNIREDAPPTTKTQLFFGVTALLAQRPQIKKFYLLAPRLRSSSDESNGPRWEIAFCLPGYDCLRKAIEDTIAEIGPPPAAKESSDPLRRKYEGLGFQVDKEYPALFGLPDGARRMWVERSVLMGKLIRYQLRNSQHLTAEQLGILETIKERELNASPE